MVESLVSIIIPTYNRPKLLSRLLDSISHFTYENIEIVVVDDNSTENNEDIIEYYNYKPYKIIYVKNPANVYAEMSRRVGYKACHGEYVIFCDDDDYYTNPDFVQIAMDVFHDNKGISFVSGNADIYIKSENVIKKKRINVTGRINGEKYIKNFQIKFDKPLSTFTTIFNKNSLNGDDVFFNDSSIYLSALLCGDAYILQDVVGNYYIHDSNITSNIRYNFVMEILESKYLVSKSLASTVDWDVQAWWEKQLILTSKYYIRSGKKTTNDIINYMHIVLNKYNDRMPVFKLFCIKEIIKKGFIR